MNLFEKIIASLSNIKERKLSFSQSGEDMIVDFVLNGLNISNVRYLDIGAHHPSYLSNTYHFYLKGHTGVCIEPNPNLCRLFQKHRPKDTLLNVGIGVANNTDADYFIMSSSTLNTFSHDDAKRCQKFESQKIEQILKIPLIPVTEVIRKYFQKAPNFISLDVEGNDFEILQSFDFSLCRPEVFCVETLSYTENNTEEKIKSVIDFMLEQDFMVYADTYINTIFVDRGAWRNRGQIAILKE